MTKPLIQIGIETREMTDAEFEQWQTDNKAHIANLETAAKIIKARATALAKLEALGLTATEIAALVGQ